MEAAKQRVVINGWQKVLLPPITYYKQSRQFLSGSRYKLNNMVLLGIFKFTVCFKEEITGMADSRNPGRRKRNPDLNDSQKRREDELADEISRSLKKEYGRKGRTSSGRTGASAAGRSSAGSGRSGASGRTAPRGTYADYSRRNESTRNTYADYSKAGSSRTGSGKAGYAGTGSGRTGSGRGSSSSYGSSEGSRRGSSYSGNSGRTQAGSRHTGRSSSSPDSGRGNYRNSGSQSEKNIRSGSGSQGRGSGKYMNAAAGDSRSRKGTAGMKRNNGGARRKKTGRGGKPVKHMKLKFILRIVLFILLILVLGCVVAFYFKYGSSITKWRNDAKRIVKNSSEKTFQTSLTSVIYASDGSRIAELKGDRETFYLESDKIPEYVKDAFVDTEDRSFYKHKGYDLKAIMSASIQLIRSKVLKQGIQRGGSTITQQLARGVFLSYDKTIERKIKEIFIAVELEKKYSKEDILEFYINNVYFANGYYGIEAAARGYFSKSASDLDLAETAFLCSIPNRPALYDPLQHFDNTVSRKNRILKEMLGQKSITEKEYNKALKEDIVLDPEEKTNPQNYMTSYAAYCATRALMRKKGFKFRYTFDDDKDRSDYEKEYEEAYNSSYKALYSNGYKIYTSLNKKKQKALQEAVNDQLKAFKDKTSDKVYKLQGAATCIDNNTGRVVAIVGGRRQKNVVSYLNRAYQSYRQPGSSFKPLAVYTPILERGYTPNSTVDDSYIQNGPKNADGVYLGRIPLRTAVEKSKNVVAWRLFEQLTPAVGLSYVQKMQFSEIVKDDYVLSSAIGGLTKGVTTAEMASGYATIENGGVFRNPTCIKKITDPDDKVIVKAGKESYKKTVYKSDAAKMMTDILEGVLIRGTAAGHGLSNMPAAGKTGTTNDKKDGWFCGFTPYYTTCVWVGCDNPEPVYGLTGSSYPLNIWHQYMEEAHKGLSYKDFDLTLSGQSGTTSSYSGGSTSYTQAPSYKAAVSAAPTQVPEASAPAGTFAPESRATSSPEGETGETGTAGNSTSQTAAPDRTETNSQNSKTGTLKNRETTTDEDTAGTKKKITGNDEKSDETETSTEKLR